MKNPADLPPQEPASSLPVRHGAAPPSSNYYQLDVPQAIESSADAEPGGLVEYWRILCRRKGTVILFATLGTIAAILLSLPQTPIYQARSVLEILSINEDLLNKRQLDATASTQDFDPQFNIKTQISILQSKTLLERVAAKMKALHTEGWPNDATRLSAWRRILRLKQAQLPATANASPGCVLLVNSVAGTRLVQLLCDSPNPKFAAEYVNTLANEFIDQNVEVRYQASQRTGEWLKTQLEELKIKLEKSESELQESARVVGLQFTGEKDSVSEERLKQVQEELSKAQADRAAKQSLYELATSAPVESLPEVLDDTAMEAYQTKRAELRQQVAELTTSLTPEHYKVMRVQAQITEVEAALIRQRAIVLARVRNEYDAALRREKLLDSAYEAQSQFVTDQAEKAIHYNILKREVDSTRQLYDGMLQKVKEYSIASAMQASNVRVVDAAEPPVAPYKPDHIRNASLGLMAGLLLGVAFVIIRERADRSIQAPGETALYIHAPELGVIPSATLDALQQEIYSGHRRTRPRTPAEGELVGPDGQSVALATFQRKPTLIAESVRTVLASILFSGQNGDHPRVVVMTSPAPKEGKTTLVSNLGLALAEIHSRVLLIDADFRRPRLHNIFDIPNKDGLANILVDRSPLNGKPIGIETSYQGVYVLPAGESSHTAFNLLYSPRLRELLDRAREEFDMVFIDSPPMINMSDARVVGRLADGVVIVIRAGRTTRDTLQTAAQRFGEDGTPIIGTILNDWDPKKNAGYGYGYAYRSYDHYYEHYYKHYGPDTGKQNGRG